MQPAIYRRLTDAVELFRANRSRRDSWIRAFFDALDWRGHRAGFSMEPRNGAGSGYRLSVDGRAVVNVLPAAANDIERIADVLNLS